MALMEDRTPVVTVELQPGSSAPQNHGVEPLGGWGAGMLDFHIRRRRSVEVVWRAELPEVASQRCASVKQVPGFGWVLVLRFTHDGAKRLLSGAGLPAFLEGEEAAPGISAERSLGAGPQVP